MNQEAESRAELKRKYKEEPKQAGVFVITCQANGRLYLGSSLNLHGSLNKHRFLLDYRNHWTRALQEDWNLHGAGKFTFELIEVERPANDPDFDVKAGLEKLEQVWLQQTEGKRYNKGQIRE